MTLPPLEDLDPAPVVPRTSWRPSPPCRAPTPEGPIADDDIEALFFGDDDPDTVREVAAASRSAAVAMSAGLKPFPAAARRALEVLDHPAFRVDDLERVIEQDTALATKLLRIANSAAMGGRVKCSSIRQAIVRLGSRTVRGLVVSLVSLRVFDDTGGLGRQVRDHSAAVGSIMRLVGSRLGMTEIPELLLCGLLHDLGKMLCMQAGDLDYAALPAEWMRAPDRIHLVERRRLGYDHAVLGAHVLRQWRVPEPIPEVVALHHRPARAYEVGGQVARLVAVLRVADQMEYVVRPGPTSDRAAVAALAQSTDCAYAGLDEAHLEALVPLARKARDESSGLVR